MNSETPDWCFEFGPPSTKINNGQDHDLVELLWQNGQVVLHSQTNRKPSPNGSDARQPYSRDDVAGAGVSSGNVCNPIPDAEIASWIHYPVEDSFEKEFCSQFFGELPSMDIDKQTKQVEHEKAVNFGPFLGSSQQHNTRNATVLDISRGQMPPPRFQFPDPTWQVYDNSLGGSGKVVNFSQFVPTLKGETRPPSFQTGRHGLGILSQVDVRECSAKTVGSSRCGSNQIPNDFPDQSRASSNGVHTAVGVSAGLAKEEDCNILSLSQTEGRRTETLEPTLTSSSSESDGSFGATAKQCVDVSISHKRKRREGKEPECQSEALEIESAGGKKSITRSGGSTRRSRAAEVHNQSERRRRDRINKKMKALQELIPHCNKTDKASMLDEAIEYLKSLQLQLQVMWMGGGMSPMMFPGAQHYMSSMGMTMCPPTMPSVHPNMHMHMPGIPMIDQSFPMAQSMSKGMFGQAPVMNPMSFQNQMPHPSFPEQFARYMGMHNIQTPQAANLFKFGCQQNQTNSQPRGSSTP